MSYKRYHVWAHSCKKKIIFNDLLILFSVYFQFIFGLFLVYCPRKILNTKKNNQ